AQFPEPFVDSLPDDHWLTDRSVHVELRPVSCSRPGGLCEVTSGDVESQGELPGRRTLSSFLRGHSFCEARRRTRKLPELSHRLPHGASTAEDLAQGKASSVSARPIRLGIFVTHPIQYFAPLWRQLARSARLELSVYFFSDHSVRGGIDPG